MTVGCAIEHEVNLGQPPEEPINLVGITLGGDDNNRFICWPIKLPHLRP